MLKFSDVEVEEKMGSDYSQIFSWDDPAQRKASGKTLCQVLDGILRGYHNRVDKEGVVVEQPVAKKARRGRRVSKNAPGKDESTLSADQQPEVKIGTTKREAIKNILNFATPESYKAMMHHTSFCGGDKRSALTDNVLAWKHLWTTSPPPDGQVPTEAEEVARRANASMTKRLLPERVTPLGCFYMLNPFMLFLFIFRSKPLEFGMPLSPQEHEALNLEGGGCLRVRPRTEG